MEDFGKTIFLRFFDDFLALFVCFDFGENFSVAYPESPESRESPESLESRNSRKKK